MKVIGLTGNIASGKSEVSKILSDLGAVVIDMDNIGKDVQRKNKSGVMDKIISTFGNKFIKNGKFDRRAFGNYVFSDKEALSKLNEIMIPAMTEELKRNLNDLSKEGVKIVVVDAAILFEAGWDKFTDEVWVVYTPKALQLKRLRKRENISEDEALIRIEAQMPIEEKIHRADFVIDNSGDLATVKKQVLRLWGRIKNSI